MGNKLPLPEGLASNSPPSTPGGHDGEGALASAQGGPHANLKAQGTRPGAPNATGAGAVSDSGAIIPLKNNRGLANGPALSPEPTLGREDSDSPRSGANIDINFEDIDIQRRFSHVGGRAVSIHDFELLKVLGKGSFGKVMLVRFKAGGTADLYAMKTLRKEALIRRNQLTHTSTERFVLQNIRHPFLMRLAFAFQTRDKLYMVVDYMAGGELFFWLKKGKFTETRAKLYAAEITCALDALHSHNIVYRDLKPENILLDAEGHIRLTDFGLSKGNVTGYGAEGGTGTFCGTPEYLAPEVLENKGHGKGIDWWSLGTLLYEMICGLPPFYDQNVQKMYKKIMSAPLTPPKILSESAMQVISGLLQRKPAQRLGCGPNGALDIKRQPFFACYDWNKVLEREYRPEFTPPKRRRSVDVDNFDKEFTAEPAVDSLVQTHLDANQVELTKFEGFTYMPQSRLAGGGAAAEGRMR